jgi:immunity-specific protein beta241|uniref:Tail tape measure protein n=1 Tax=Myoviridae sp. ctqMr7 TaxID=2823552 RepID=A0A8S5LHW1_9CAUD|nr:MAG TPA: tail tape measure protein [Myoviridae sp. ctqMr7]
MSNTITLTVRADTKQFETLMKSAGKTVDDFSRRNKRSLESIANSANNMAGKVQGAMKLLGATLVGGSFGLNAFVKEASTLQSVRASFESLTGSAEGARKVMAQLNKFSLETAFSADDINAAARTLLGAGVSVDKLGSRMKWLGDIAGATGANLGQLVLPVSQALAKGKLDTQDFYQILNSGAGKVREVLQNELNKRGLGDVMTALSKGKVSAEILETALKNAASEGGFAFNGAAKQAQTFDGRMSNLQETISNVGLELIGVNKATGEIDPNGIFAQMSEKVEKATKWLEENKEKIKDVAQIIINNIQPAMITLTALWASFKAVVVASEIVDAITKVSDAVGKMGDGVKKAAAWYQDLNKAQIASSVSAKAHAVAVGLQTAATNIATVAQTAFNVAMAANPIGLIVLAIAAVVAGLVWFFTQTEIGKQIFGEFVKFVSGVFGNIVSVISTVANAIIVPFQNFLAFVSPIFNTLWQIVSSIFILIVALVATAIESIAQPFIWLFQNWQTVWNNICGFVSTIWNMIVGVVTAYIDTMNAIISTIVNAIMTVISPIVNWINDNIIQPIANFFSGLWNGIVQGVSGFIQGVMNVISPITNWINSNIIQPVSRFFSGLWNGIVQGVNGLAAGIKTVFSSIIAIIKAPINAVIGGINSIFRTLNGVTVPSWVPGLGGAHPTFPMFPMLAKGGVVDSATMAIIGESGKEAVMPLENNTGWITNLAGQLAERGGAGGGNTVNISVNVETKGGDFEEADAINIAKKINTALKSQGLSFDQMGALR